MVEKLARALEFSLHNLIKSRLAILLLCFCLFMSMAFVEKSLRYLFTPLTNLFYHYKILTHRSHGYVKVSTGIVRYDKRRGLANPL